MNVRPLRQLLNGLSRRDRRRRPTIESLETRELLTTTFTVTNAADNGNNVFPLPGSLRWAIVQADALAPGTASTIKFAISGGAFQTIALQGPLPQVTTPATIDGTTQTGYTGTPLIELDGASAGAGANGLSYARTASGTAAVQTQLKGLQIFAFSGAGVVNSGAAYLSLTNDYVGVQRPATYYLARGNTGGGVVISGGADYDTITSCVISANASNAVTITGSGTNNNTVSADDIGTDASGVTVVDHDGKTLANIGSGVLISGGASHNTVTTSVLSDNTNDGVDLNGSGTSFNIVSGDHVGTDVFGMVALPDGNNGVEITGGASANTVGGTTAAARDVISGNTNSGVSISASATTNVVEGDFIGTDGTGTVAIPNYTGVLLGAASSNTVGGTAAGSGDVISGNRGIGVWLTSGSSKDIVAGDDIGTDLTGSKSVPNGTGLQVDAASTSNTVGGTAAGARDVISGNTGAGVSISDSGTDNNLVAGDDIGTNATGAAALGNGTDGILIANSAHGNTVGGTTAATRNIISGNTQYGVEVTGGVTATTIAGNDIGTDLTGSLAVPNQFGVLIDGGSTANTIGGTVAGSLNVISANVHKAVTLSDAGTDDNVVEGNLIGTDASGTHALGNGGAGVAIVAGAQYNTVGGTTAAARNIMAASNGNGVIIDGIGTNNASTSYNLVEGNDIGTDKTGTAALGEGIAGVNIESGGTYNTIGGTTAAARNIISGSYFDVYIGYMGADDNLVEGDYIGTDVTGSVALGNTSGGVYLVDGAAGNTVGGTTAAARNVISGNPGNGVVIYGPGTTGNMVEGNYLGTDASGEHALGNGDPTDGANDVVITDGASDNTIGGTTPGARNVIAATTGTGVVIGSPGTDDNVVAGNYIGTDATGTHAMGNSYWGVYLNDGASNNTIGGTTTGAGNVIAANVGEGVGIVGPGADDNVVAGNFIGTDATGSHALGNSLCGVAVFGGASGNTVGGTTAAARNVISGNVGPGVYISDPGTNGNVVEGDYIGTDATGAHALGNGSGTPGVWIIGGAQQNTIGGTSAAARDVISGNGFGVYIGGVGTDENVVEGDYIGTDSTGTVAIGNLNGGVFLMNGATDNTVGGTTAADRDVISGNGGSGVYLSGTGTDDNVAEGDYIGTDYTGAHALGNGNGGVILIDGAAGNTIGGTTPASRDIISSNVGAGLTIDGSGTTDNVAVGDYIGTDLTGTVALGNTNGGVFILDGGSDNTVGGTTAGSRDVISGNIGTGVTIYSSGTTGNVVTGDDIGTAANGIGSLGNSWDGVVLDGVTGNSITNSVICFNGAYGIEGISGSNATNNTINGDTFTITIGTTTYGNKLGATYYQ